MNLSKAISRLPTMDSIHSQRLRDVADAQLAIAASTTAASRALLAGSTAPRFALRDTQGRIVFLEALLRRGPVVLHFLRGDWCTLSRQSLDAFAASIADVARLGATALALSPAHGDGQARSPLLPASQLCDIGMRVARQFGLAFQLPADLRARYAALGYRPPAGRHGEHWLVPIPATYLIDTDGLIAMALIDVDYRNPFDAAPLLMGLRSVVRRQAHRAS